MRRRKSFRSDSKPTGIDQTQASRARIQLSSGPIRRLRARGENAQSAQAQTDLGIGRSSTYECPDQLAVAAASVAALALSACGSSSLSGEPGTESAPSVSVSENVDLASKLPESIRTAGVIKIGTDATYAPNEFLAGDGKTVQGMDIDVFNAVAAKFGVKTEWEPVELRQHHHRCQRQEVRHRHLVVHH